MSHFCWIDTSLVPCQCHHCWIQRLCFPLWPRWPSLRRLPVLLQVLCGGAGSEALAQQQIRVRHEAQTSRVELREETLGWLHHGKHFRKAHRLYFKRILRSHLHKLKIQIWDWLLFYIFLMRQLITRFYLISVSMSVIRSLFLWLSLCLSLSLSLSLSLRVRATAVCLCPQLWLPV